MAKYDVLVSHLRECAKLDKSENTFAEAANAIEDLARRLEENPVSIRFTKEDKQMILEYRKEVDAIDARAAVMNAVSLALDHDDWMPKKGEWIPVTERLPKEGQVVCVSDGKSTWDYGTFRGVFNTNGEWYWKKRTIKTVKWWMLKSDALPEPPKEETC